MTKEEFYPILKNILINDFDIDEKIVTLEAEIENDLDLDSIDSVDMIVKLKPYLTKSIEPAVFKSVKTVQDVVDVLQPLTC